MRRHLTLGQRRPPLRPWMARDPGAIQPERLARMAESGNWLHGCHSRRRRRPSRTLLAISMIMVMTAAAIAAWLAL